MDQFRFKIILSLLSILCLAACNPSSPNHKITDPVQSSAIVGGEHVSLLDSSLDGVLALDIGHGYCTAVQVAENLVLTAAHCSKFLGSRIEIGTYVKKLNQFDSKSVNGIFQLHPLYTSVETANDLAYSMFESGQALDPKDNFALPTSPDLPEELYIAGYGFSTFNRVDSAQKGLKRLKISKSLQLPAISQKFLGNDLIWEEDPRFQTISQNIENGNLYCFKSLSRKVDVPFSGDSGGPLYSIDENGQKTVHGIFSIFIFNRSDEILFFYCYEAIYPKLPWLRKSIEKTKAHEQPSLQVQFLNNEVRMISKIVEGVDISEPRITSGEIIDAGLGRIEDISGLNMNGKIVLIKRGEISFADKILHVLTANTRPLGIIFYNHIEGELFTPMLQDRTMLVGLIDRTDIRFISQKDGESILKEIKMGNKVFATFTVPHQKK
jgi:hypothetical protein